MSRFVVLTDFSVVFSIYTLRARPRSTPEKISAAFSKYSLVVFVQFPLYEDVLVKRYKKYLRLSANIFYKHSLTRIRVSVKI